MACIVNAMKAGHAPPCALRSLVALGTFAELGSTALHDAGGERAIIQAMMQARADDEETQAHGLRLLWLLSARGGEFASTIVSSGGLPATVRAMAPDSAVSAQAYGMGVLHALAAFDPVVVKQAGGVEAMHLLLDGWGVSAESESFDCPQEVLISYLLYSDKQFFSEFSMTPGYTAFCSLKAMGLVDIKYHVDLEGHVAFGEEGSITGIDLEGAPWTVEIWLLDRHGMCTAKLSGAFDSGALPYQRPSPHRRYKEVKHLLRSFQSRIRDEFGREPCPADLDQHLRDMYGEFHALDEQFGR